MNGIFYELPHSIIQSNNFFFKPQSCFLKAKLICLSNVGIYSVCPLLFYNHICLYMLKERWLRGREIAGGPEPPFVTNKYWMRNRLHGENCSHTGNQYVYCNETLFLHVSCAKNKNKAFLMNRLEQFCSSSHSLLVSHCY